MSIHAGFAEVDITPPVGISKIGWIKDIKADRILDPLYGRVAIFESDGETIAFVQMDTLQVRWTQTNEIRQHVAERFGYPGDRVMVCATHNHAGPAVADAGEVQMDLHYTAQTVERIVTAFGEAQHGLATARIGMGRCFEFGVSQNRRVIMRDGTVRTHGTFDDPEALCLGGPIDPEVAVIGARGADGRLMGCLVNFACHPTHHGGDTAISAGFPGVLAARLKRYGCPVTLFLNGASGNIHTADPTQGGRDRTMEEVGNRLSEDVRGVLGSMTLRSDVRLDSRLKSVELPYREPTEEEVEGRVRGAQRFVDPRVYDDMIPAIVERIRERGVQPAEIQAHVIDECVLVSVPCELFVQYGLQIKAQAHPRQALIVGYANGQIGYVPHKEAFERGGYETTFGPSSQMGCCAGDLLTNAALELIRETPTLDAQAE
ncbi:MAG TPA: hypothetical protein PLO37_04210 [Candidatus Hydrogenedentes bacterium]|nr:hypothetical protein [Candidatus Hydrogenedentota bacterium]HPG66028.1 hypothetical protein [Candidatus Hydrogenedentota bacterium]